MRKKPTIADIARETGLSITSISLVLNDRPNKISKASRKRILDAARRLDYHPNPQAVSLVSNRTKTIAQIIPDITNSFFAGMVQGTDSVARPRGYSVLLCYTDNDPAREIEATKEMLARGVDGILIASSNNRNGDEFAKLLERTYVPVVMIDRVMPEALCSSLCYDHRRGGYLAAKHLLRLGHRKIACIYGGRFLSLARAPRLQGFIQAHREAGLEVDESGFFSGDFRLEGGYALLPRIVEQGYSAVFCCNDAMALGVYQRANELNLPIPSALSVVGYDDLRLASLISPPLTTVAQCPHTLGSTAASRLFAEMEDPSLPHRMELFEPSLVERASTAAFPATRQG